MSVFLDGDIYIYISYIFFSKKFLCFCCFFLPILQRIRPVLSLGPLAQRPVSSHQAMDSAQLASKEGGLSRGTGGLMTQAATRGRGTGQTVEL